MQFALEWHGVADQLHRATPWFQGGEAHRVKCWHAMWKGSLHGRYSWPGACLELLPHEPLQQQCDLAAFGASSLPSPESKLHQILQSWQAVFQVGSSLGDPM